MLGGENGSFSAEKQDYFLYYLRFGQTWLQDKYLLFFKKSQ